MKIIYDKNTKKVLYHTGTNLMFPEGPPDEALDLKENMATFSLHDTEDAEKVQQVLNAKEYELVFESNKPVDIKIIQIIKEYLATIPPIEKEPIDEEKVAMAEAIVDLEMRLSELEKQLQGGNQNA